VQKQSIGKGFAILSAATIAVKCLSFIYVPFLRIILGGDGPYGVYSITYTIYAFVYVITSTGIPSAISKLVAEYAAVGDFRSANRVFTISRSLLFGFGLVMSLIMLLIAGPITSGIGSSESKLSVIALCPAILFTSIASAYRGYFQGHRNMKPTAISQVLEQILNLIFSLLFAYLFIKKGVAYGCAGATIGTTVGAFASGLYLVILYEKDKHYQIGIRNDHSIRTVNTRKMLLSRIIKFSIPITLCIGLINAGPLIDGANIITRLSSIGYSKDQALALYGMYSKYIPLLNMPISIISALAMTILPAISAAAALHDYKLLKSKMNFAFRITFMIAIPSAFGFAALGKPIYQLLGYGSGYEIMVWGAAIVVLSALVQIQTSILQGMGKLYAVTFYMALGMAFKFIINYIFVSIPAINIYGALVGNAVGFGIPVVFNIIYIQKHLHTKINFRPHIARPFLSSVCMTAVVLGSYIICYHLFGFGLSGYLLNAISAVIAIVLGVLVYFYVLIYCGGITSDEFDMIPGRMKRFIPVRLTSKYK
jgi:stage V sporulation protein B